MATLSRLGIPLRGPSPKKETLADIRSTLGDRPIRYVLNTHTHYDHVALNPAFQRRCGAEIINQRATPLPAEGRWFDGPRRRVHMLPMPGCHTPEDCIVWVPEDRALFVGDIFGWGLINLSTTLGPETAELLVDTHRRLIDYGAEYVIPGHGPLCTTAELQRWVEYFAWLHEQVCRACGEGKADAQILGDLSPPEDMQAWWRFVQWKHEDSLAKVLRAVRKGWTAG